MYSASSTFGLLALLAGGVVGALVRVVIAKVLVNPSRFLVWAVESGVGLAFGAALAVVFISTSSSSGLVPSGLGGALTAYSGACAAYAAIHARQAQSNLFTACAVHFFASSIVTGIGYVGVIASSALLRSH